MKFLFASINCILDPTSGAAITMRVLLAGLAARGHDVAACTATVFDSANGAQSVSALFKRNERPRQLLVHNAGVRHLLVPTSHWARGHVTAAEMEHLDEQYRALLAKDPPDVVISYGGMVTERFMLSAAREAGIRTAFMLVNPSYRHLGYFRHVDHVFTDSQSTAALYKERLGLHVTPIGGLLEQRDAVSPQRDPQYVTFINPSFEKGVALVARLALMCLETAPDMRFLIVESRGRWVPSLEKMGLSPDQFPNVTVIPTQNDMRPVYEKTRVLLIPSMWYESGARVGMEALVNGIPMVVESKGGTKDLLGTAPVVLDIPDVARDRPDQLPEPQDVTAWHDELFRLHRDEAYFASIESRVKLEARRFDSGHAIDRFLDMLAG
jgi:glycosyltransferase involved in cell wall biosynthesis